MLFLKELYDYYQGYLTEEKRELKNAMEMDDYSDSSSEEVH